jgi:hypothetical protein
VSLVELDVGADVDDQRAGGAALIDLARGERQQLDARGHERPAVQVDDRLEVGRLRAQARERALDELALPETVEQGVVAALVADRRSDLHVHSGTAAERAAEMAGPDLGLRRERQ